MSRPPSSIKPLQAETMCKSICILSTCRMKYKRGPSQSFSIYQYVNEFLQGKLPCLTFLGLTVVREHREVTDLGEWGTITSAGMLLSQIGSVQHLTKRKRNYSI